MRYLNLIDTSWQVSITFRYLAPLKHHDNHDAIAVNYSGFIMITLGLNQLVTSVYLVIKMMGNAQNA